METWEEDQLRTQRGRRGQFHGNPPIAVLYISVWTKVVDRPTTVPKYTDYLCWTALYYIAKRPYYFVHVGLLVTHAIHRHAKTALADIPTSQWGVMNAVVGGFQAAHDFSPAQWESRDKQSPPPLPLLWHWDLCAAAMRPLRLSCPRGDTRCSCTAAPLYFQMGEKADVCSHFSNSLSIA